MFQRAALELKYCRPEWQTTIMGSTNRATDAASNGRWLAFVVLTWMAFGAWVAKAQDEPPAPEPAPEPFNPQ
jgi:hypothetical protein